MSTWIPVTLICEAIVVDAANRLAHIIDPDTGGVWTFGDFAYSADGAEPVTHYGTESMLAPEYLALVQLQDAALIDAALTALAAEYGRDPPDPADCALFAQYVTPYPERHMGDVAAELGLVRL